MEEKIWLAAVGTAGTVAGWFLKEASDWFKARREVHPLLPKRTIRILPHNNLNHQWFFHSGNAGELNMVVTATFKVTNISTRPVTLQNARMSCSPTVGYAAVEYTGPKKRWRNEVQWAWH